MMLTILVSWSRRIAAMSGFTTDERRKAIERGVYYLYSTASESANFDIYGCYFLACFTLLCCTSKDASLRTSSRKMARRFARKWQKDHSHLPLGATPDSICDFAVALYSTMRLGLVSEPFRDRIYEAAKRFDSIDFLGFDPTIEPPSDDMPYPCQCGIENRRGRKYCKRCRKKLLIKSRYRTWMEALSKTFIGQRCGVRIGASFAEVLKWTHVMRPYPERESVEDEVFEDAVYAVTHTVYTLNDYSAFSLSRRWLPQEFHFLKSNIDEAIALDDPDMTGEMLDTLKSFGLSDRHRAIHKGMNYLLSTQNEDGSWGGTDESIRNRCHTTWAALDGLRDYLWQGRRLSFPKLKTMIDQGAGSDRH